MLRVFALLFAAAIAATVSTAQVTETQEGPTPMTPEYRADVLRLVEISGAADLGTQLAEPIVEKITPLLRATRPDLPPAALELVPEVVMDVVRGIEPEFVEQLVPVYAKYLSAAELKELLVFYETPLGRKMIAITPALGADVIQAGRAWSPSLWPKSEHALVERFQQEGLLPPGEQRLLQDLAGPPPP